MKKIALPIFFLLLLSPVFSFAIIREADICVSYLLLARNQFGTKSLQESDTDKAYQAFKKFRWDVLKRKQVSPSDEVVHVTATDPLEEESLNVARRIYGIEQGLFRSSNPENSQYFNSGTIIQGKQNIFEFLVQSHYVQDEIQKIDLERGFTDDLEKSLVTVKRFFAKTLIGCSLAWFSYDVTSEFWHLHSSCPVPLISASFAALMALFTPDVYPERSPREEHRDWVHEVIEKLNYTENPDMSYWDYKSWNIPIYKDFLLRLRERSPDLEVYTLLQHLLFLRGRRMDHNMAVLDAFVDRLFYFDPDTKEPVLVLFFRSSFPENSKFRGGLGGKRFSIKEILEALKKPVPVPIKLK